MKINKHNEVLSDTGEEIIAFEITGKKGQAMGFLHQDVIVIHHIHGQGAVKGLMNILCKDFKTTKFRFTMVINPQLKNIIRGTVRTIPIDDPGNPFGEPQEIIEGNWNCT